MHEEHEAVIETGIAWLAGWWPLLALPGAFVAGFGMGWLLRREDMLQAQRELKRRADAYDQLAAEAIEDAKCSDAYAAQIVIYRRDWQALRAIVEQHTVKT